VGRCEIVLFVSLRKRQEERRGGDGQARVNEEEITNVAGVSECAGKVVEEIFGEDGGHYFI